MAVVPNREGEPRASSSWRPFGRALVISCAGLALLLVFLALAFRQALIEAKRAELARAVDFASGAIDFPAKEDQPDSPEAAAIPSPLTKLLHARVEAGYLGSGEPYLLRYGEGGAADDSPAALLVAAARGGGGFLRYPVRLGSGGRRWKLAYIRGFDEGGFLIAASSDLGDLDHDALVRFLPTSLVAVLLAALLLGLVFLSLRPFYRIFGRLRAGFAALSSDPGSSPPISEAGFRAASEPHQLLMDYNRMVERIVAYEHERIEAEVLLHRDNDEKRLLLQEIHHRVKNNLQVIVSLLNLQAGSKNREGCRACMGEATGRIRSMATMHELLYESGDFSSLDFPAYVEHIARTSAQAADVRCRLEFSLEPLRLGLDRAVPCGLIVNEALTNAIKYGRGGDGSVRISLGLYARDAQVILEVADSGPGFPPDFDGAFRGPGLGRTLMASLAQQARGEIQFECREGALVRLLLPD